jgi:hypothetical protein
VLEPGRVPTAGTIHLEQRHPAGITVAHVQAARNDRANTYNDIAALEPLSPGLKLALAWPNRDLSGGVPEED